MNKHVITFIILLFVGCPKSKAQIIESVKNNLVNGKAIAYTIEEITIEGKSIGDRFQTSNVASFEALQGDSIIGYKYHVRKDLIHPRFHVPITIRLNYDGNVHVKTLDSNPKKDKIATSRKKIEPSTFRGDFLGQLPMIVDILNLDGYTLQAKTDTILQKVSCIKLSAVDINRFAYELYINKATLLPWLLRIVVNKEQPFIREYYYSDFKNYDSYDSLLAIRQSIARSDSITEAEETEALGVGDRIPNWSLQYTDGTPLQMNETKGTTTILFISSIFCGPCRMALPAIERIHNTYSKAKNINCKVFYPYDKREKLVAYMKDKEIKYQILCNPLENKEERMAVLSQINYGLPTTMILNSNNQIVWIESGYKEDLEDKIMEMVEKISPGN
ncbi:TlpA disulfide reductase family protein [uncultured Sunxiuqinia sp.]|uniref:TlpA family protein disulfide reductase n=1 Tax=uncultured Sunxiuqinia sp. TaxID=1573825 RepID=UPI002638FC6D|nr:TlpA disulfide reductase family protein [uncultured Sunxiuqinia sp.]